MAVRFRAHLRYNIGSGYAQWLYDQMQVRLGMAFHMNEGSANEERTVVVRDIVTGGNPSARRENITLDVFWPSDREDLAIDTRATIEATIPWLRVNEGRHGRSWMEWHYCNHSDDNEPCDVVEWSWP
jgi:hypothetical protein